MIKKFKNFEIVEELGRNQFVIHFENGCIFQSYDSIIAYKINEKCYLTSKWNYSRTTMKYLYLFLEDYCYFNKLNKKEIEKLIEENTFKLVD